MDPMILPPELTLPAVKVSPSGALCNTSYLREPIVEDFIVPAVSNVGAVRVCDNLQYAENCFIYIVGGGFFKVISRASTDTLLVMNVGTYGNAAATTVVPEGSDLFLAGFFPPNKHAWAIILSTCGAAYGDSQILQTGSESVSATAGSVDETLAGAVAYPQPFGSAIAAIVLSARFSGSLGGLFSLYAKDNVAGESFDIKCTNSFSVNQTFIVDWIAFPSCPLIP